MIDEAKFLIARLREFESSLPEGEAVRQYVGHVAPAIARLEAALREGAAVENWLAAEAEVEHLRSNILALLENDKDVVRVREGGGPEDICASLAVTVVKTRKHRDEAIAAAKDVHR
jgi:hypothetical protein